MRLQIDGRPVTGRKGETILMVAQRHGIFIPTLCNLPGIHPAGACRVCLVEVEGQPKPVPACATQACHGMVIVTNSEHLQQLRWMIVELLLAERNHTCPVCIMNNRCELQRLAASLGIDHVRYRFMHPRCSVDISHLRFGLDHNRCILCRRCVRTCDQVEGAHTWDVLGRGAASRIICDLAKPWEESITCTGCGKCIQVCPTGALFDKEDDEPKNPAMIERLMAWRNRSQP